MSVIQQHLQQTTWKCTRSVDKILENEAIFTINAGGARDGETVRINNRIPEPVACWTEEAIIGSLTLETQN